MSIEQTDVIDIISTDRLTGDVVLTVSDHLDWSDSTAHQLLLQSKLNRYLAFVESGEIFEHYPKRKERPIVLRVAFKFPPDASGRSFLTKAKAVIEAAGFRWRDEVLMNMIYGSASLIESAGLRWRDEAFTGSDNNWACISAGTTRTNSDPAVRAPYLSDLISIGRCGPLLLQLADNRAQTYGGATEVGGAEAMNDPITDLLAA